MQRRFSVIWGTCPGCPPAQSLHLCRYFPPLVFFLKLSLTLTSISAIISMLTLHLLREDAMANYKPTTSCFIHLPPNVSLAISHEFSLTSTPRSISVSEAKKGSCTPKAWIVLFFFLSASSFFFSTSVSSFSFPSSCFFCLFKIFLHDYLHVYERSI